MRIGLVATRLGAVDGVSFESLKWQHVLERMGHEVIQCAGALGGAPGGTLIPEMHLAYPAAARVTEAAFDPTSDAAAVRHEVERLAASLRAEIDAWVAREAIDVLIVQNAWAIPMHLPLGVALARVVAASGMPAIGHHHDYWWERERFGFCVVPEMLDEGFPPDLPSVRHVSINTLAAAELRARRGLDSVVVPNVFDFDQHVPERLGERARLLRAEFRMPPDGVLFVQPTRVVPRKGIELAIELVARLELPNSTLLITSPAGDEGTAYLVGLHELADELGVDFHYGASRFEPDNSNGPQGPAHSLAEAYLAADVITYPSLYEGYGNALVEAVFFRKLVVVNRYPVYEADIRPLGFRFLELDGAVTDEAVEAVRAALAHADRRAADREHNFEVGRRHLSYDRLERELEALLGELG